VRTTAAIFLAAAFVVACGPSTKQVKSAQTARYKASVETIFTIAEETAKESHAIKESDAARGAFITEAKWYTPEGGVENAGVEAQKLADNSLQIAMLVRVVPDGDAVKVEVVPLVMRYRLGQTQLEKVEAEDASLPGWVGGKAEALQLSIHEKAKVHSADSGAGSAAAPAPAPN
jgi:hypothetical protein